MAYEINRELSEKTIAWAERTRAELENAKKVAAYTEALCYQARDAGPGYRLWRSDPIPLEPPAYEFNYRFQILGPGEDAPGSGTIFGPWPD